MHDIEPHYIWQDRYNAAEDERSPFYGRVYDEFSFTNKIYNYFIHPQWDGVGSPTLYTKVLFVDYDEGYAILEMLGEWNDCLHNDSMFLKRNLIDFLIKDDIYKFILICENILNFHSGDDDYYEEWQQEVAEEDGWICFLNTLDHVEEEMEDARLQAYLHFGGVFNGVKWRPYKPKQLFQQVEQRLSASPKQLW